MTAYIQAPEENAKETWQWQTDILVSDNGTEQRIDNCELPIRYFDESVIFTTEADLRSALNAMFGFGAAFERPLYVYQTLLTAAAAAADTALVFNAERCDLRDGGRAYLYDQTGGELLDVTVVTSGGCTLGTPLSRPYAVGARIAPVTTVMSGTNAEIDRLNPDYAAQANVSLREIKFLDPFVSPLNTQTLVTLAGLPILPHRPIGQQFADQYDTGIQMFDSGGKVDIRNPWKHAQIGFNRNFLVHRIDNPTDWEWWRVFADYARGSCNPFYIPTWRQDFDLAAPPVAGGTTLAFVGTDYAATYFPHAPFKALMITTAAGTHYATVSNAVADGANSDVTFTPALPVGDGWSTILGVSMLLKARIADDKVVCYHGNLDTQVELNLRTTDA